MVGISKILLMKKLKSKVYVSFRIRLYKADKSHNIAIKAVVLTRLRVKEHGTSSDCLAIAWWSFLNKIHSTSPDYRYS